MAEKRKDLEERRKILRDFLATGIEEWPKVTHLIVFVKDRDGNVIYHEYYDSGGAHAESNMLSDNEFLKIVKKTRNVNITLTSNYSPCSNCASELHKFYDDHRDFIKSFIIKFSFIYYLDKPANRDGLKLLSKAGITLEAMTDESWFEVFMWSVFGFNNADKVDKVRKRDSDTRKALSKLLHDVPEAGQRASATEDRENENNT